MCESFNEEWKDIWRRHMEFHDANRIVQVERRWAVDPTEYNQLRRAGEAVRYSQRPVGQRIEDVKPKGESL